MWVMLAAILLSLYCPLLLVILIIMTFTCMHITTATTTKKSSVVVLYLFIIYTESFSSMYIFKTRIVHTQTKSFRISSPGFMHSTRLSWQTFFLYKLLVSLSYNNTSWSPQTNFLWEEWWLVMMGLLSIFCVLKWKLFHCLVHI